MWVKVVRPTCVVFLEFKIEPVFGISLSKELSFLINVNFASYFSLPCLSLGMTTVDIKKLLAGMK